MLMGYGITGVGLDWTYIINQEVWSYLSELFASHKYIEESACNGVVG
jgi:hypothetical protein